MEDADQCFGIFHSTGGRQSVRDQYETVEKGIEMGIANSILIKVNQIGTLSEAFEAVEMAHKNGYKAVISHRSGETEDTNHSRYSGGTE